MTLALPAPLGQEVVHHVLPTWQKVRMLEEGQKRGRARGSFSAISIDPPKGFHTNTRKSSNVTLTTTKKILTTDVYRATAQGRRGVCTPASPPAYPASWAGTHTPTQPSLKRGQDWPRPPWVAVRIKGDCHPSERYLALNKPSLTLSSSPSSLHQECFLP